MKRIISVICCLLLLVSCVNPQKPGAPENSGATLPEDTGRLTAFSYSYGSYHEGYWKYSITQEDGSLWLRGEGANGVELNVNSGIPDHTLDEIAMIIEKCNIGSWQGFSGNDEDVLDGYSFALSAQYENFTLDAGGYMEFPENYEAGHQALAEYLDRLVADIPTPIVNKELLSLIGQPLSALEEEYGDNHYIYGLGLLTAALEYYNPYICFYFNPLGYFNPSGLPENQWDPNPFATDELIIKSIVFMADYDPELNSVADQASLCRLFFTYESITREFLNQQLGQTPELIHNPEGSVWVRTPYSIDSQTYYPPGGTYTAEYSIEDTEIIVTFLPEGEGYTALMAAVEDPFGDAG